MLTPHHKPQWVHRCHTTQQNTTNKHRFPGNRTRKLFTCISEISISSWKLSNLMWIIPSMNKNWEYFHKRNLENCDSKLCHIWMDILANIIPFSRFFKLNYTERFNSKYFWNFKLDTWEWKHLRIVFQLQDRIFEFMFQFLVNYFFFYWMQDLRFLLKLWQERSLGSNALVITVERSVTEFIVSEATPTKWYIINNSWGVMELVFHSRSSSQYVTFVEKWIIF